MFERLIRAFDIYGSPFNLRINGESKFKSFTGGFLSLITLGVLLLTIIYFGKNFYARTNPKITIEDGIYQDSEIPILNGTSYKDEKVLMFEYSKKIEKYIYPNILTFDESGSQVFNLVPDCDQNYLNSQSNIVSQGMSYKCLKLNDFNIGGMSASDYAQPMNINWLNCQDYDDVTLSANNMTNCDRDYNQTISAMFLTVYYVKIGFAPSLENPFIQKLVPMNFILTPDKISFLNFPISVYNLNDDKGWIFNTTETSLNFNFLTPQITYYPQFDASAKYPISSILIYVADDYKVFTRNYEKIQDLLAVIGGFMKLVFALLNIFNSVIRAYLMDSYMVSRIFDQCETPQVANIKLNDKNKRKIKHNDRTNPISPGPRLAKSNPRSEQSHTVNRTVLQQNYLDSSKVPQEKSISKFILKNETKRLLPLRNGKKLDYYSYIKVVVCSTLGFKFSSTTRKGKRLEQIRKKLVVADKVRDFNFVLGKMTEIESIKNLMLNEHQALTLSYLQKPNAIDSAVSTHRFSVLVNSEETNANAIKEYFIQTLEKKGTLQGTDEMLFRNLDKTIKDQIVSQVSRK